jgi:enamine deaminase RidA (YjgF/YER057c/UK114 family)
LSLKHIEYTCNFAISLHKINTFVYRLGDAWVIEGASPARACVEASLARPELLVEISVVAAVIKPEFR